MIPHPGTPVADRFNASISRPAAILVMDRLRDLLRARDVHAAFSYTDRQPRLHVRADLTVWTNAEGTVISWAAPNGDHPEEGSDLEDIARRIAKRLTAPAP